METNKQRSTITNKQRITEGTPRLRLLPRPSSHPRDRAPPVALRLQVHVAAILHVAPRRVPPPAALPSSDRATQNKTPAYLVSSLNSLHPSLSFVHPSISIDRSPADHQHRPDLVADGDLIATAVSPWSPAPPPRPSVPFEHRRDDA
jgi:hypothetical protein